LDPVVGVLEFGVGEGEDLREGAVAVVGAAVGRRVEAEECGGG